MGSSIRDAVRHNQPDAPKHELQFRAAASPREMSRRDETLAYLFGTLLVVLVIWGAFSALRFCYHVVFGWPEPVKAEASAPSTPAVSPVTTTDNSSATGAAANNIETASNSVTASAEPKTADIAAPDETEVVTYCDMMIKQSLVSESSYSAAWSWNYSWDGAYATVMRKFDATNGFGATITSSYICKVDGATQHLAYLATMGPIGAQVLVDRMPSGSGGGHRHKKHRAG